jgi:hypothetical protein
MTVNSKHAPAVQDTAIPGTDRLWAGRGSGKPCDFCGKAIDAEDVQYDVELLESSRGPDKTVCTRNLSFHLGCYDPWRARR